MRNRILDIKESPQETTELLSLPEVKEWLVVEHDQDDALLTRMIKQVRNALELKAKISMIPKEVTLTADLYCECKLPRGPVVEITEVVAGSGNCATNQSLVSGDFSVSGELFKTFKSNRSGRHKITYLAGYGNDGYDLPESLKMAWLQEINYRYEHKGDEDKSSGISAGAMEYLKNHISYTWA